MKVIRLWLTPSYSESKLPSSLDIVLMDSKVFFALIFPYYLHGLCVENSNFLCCFFKGCKIHASIRRTLVYRFQNQIYEGRVYQISSFGVCENGGDFRTTSHPYKMNF